MTNELLKKLAGEPSAVLACMHGSALGGGKAALLTGLGSRRVN